MGGIPRVVERVLVWSRLAECHASAAGALPEEERHQRRECVGLVPVAVEEQHVDVFECTQRRLDVRRRGRGVRGEWIEDGQSGAVALQAANDGVVGRVQLGKKG